MKWTVERLYIFITLLQFVVFLTVLSSYLLFLTVVVTA